MYSGGSARTSTHAVAQRSQQMLFVHAGVVGWRGLAIVIPGRSGTGKSTLVAELVLRGAVYYSDEFAVLDDTGRVHPYRRPLVLRDERRQPQDLRLMREDDPTEPLPIGLIVAGAYQPGAAWRPTIVRGAQAVLPLIDSTVLARQGSPQGCCASPLTSRPPSSRSRDCGPRRRKSPLGCSIWSTMRWRATPSTRTRTGSSRLADDLSRVAEMRLRSSDRPTVRRRIAGWSPPATCG